MSSKKVRNTSPVRLRKVALNNFLNGVPPEEVPNKLKEELRRICTELPNASVFDPNINKNIEILMHILSMTEFDANDSENEQLLYKLLSSNIRVEAKCAIVKKCISGSFGAERLVRSIWGDYKSKDQLRKVFTKLSSEGESFRWLWMEHLMPLIYESAVDSSLKVVLSEALLECCPNVKLLDFGAEGAKLFLDKKLPSYCKHLDSIRIQKIKGWHFLWRLLVKYCGTCLHSRTDCLNRLLAIMETTFRNESLEERLTAYNCWKELIDNFCLNKSHITIQKQLNLILTPLRARLTNREAVMIKRFEVFVYLLNKLEDKATYILPEFLEFCFGTVREDSDPKKVGQAKIPALINQTARAFLRIIGKRTSPARDKNIIKQPIITGDNFNIFSSIIINSAKEATNLLLLYEKDYKIISRIWEGLVSLIVSIDDDSVKKGAFKAMNNIFQQFLEESKNSLDSEDKQKLIAVLLSSLSEADFSKVFPYLFETTLEMILISDYKLEETDLFKLLNYIFNNNKIESLISLFDCNRGNCKNINFLASIWKTIAYSLNSTITYFLNEVNEFWTYFLWPCFYLNRCSESDTAEITNLWTTNLYNLHKTKAEIISDCHPITKFHSVFKENPLLADNICVFLKNTDLKLILQNVNFKELIEFLRELIILEKSSILCIIENILLTILQKDTLKSFDFPNVAKDISPILIDVLKIRVNAHFVTALNSHLQNLNGKQLGEFKRLLNKSLTNVINSKTSEEEVKLLKELVNTLSKPKAKKIEENNSNRLSKIMNMCPPPSLPLKDSKQTVDTQTNNLCIFGSPVNSPLKTRGSLLANCALKTLGNSPKSTTPKSQKKRTIDEENSQDFVPIDTAVKFEPEKLSEHQIEVLKRRREDIPALYEDLSQSQSQDLFNLKDKDKENMEVDKHVATVEECAEIVKENDKIATDKDNNEAMSTTGNSKEEIDNVQVKIEEQENEVVCENSAQSSLTEEINEIKEKPIESENATKESQKSIPRRSYVSNELKKIQLDIVGADEFLNVQSRRGRRSLRKFEESEEPELPKPKSKSKGSKKGEGKKGERKKVLESKVEESTENQMASENLPNVVETDNERLEDKKVDINSADSDSQLKIEPIESAVDSLDNSAENRQLAEMLSPPLTPRKRGRPRKALNTSTEDLQPSENSQNTHGVCEKEVNISIDRLLVEGLTSTQNSQNNPKETKPNPPAIEKSPEIGDVAEVPDSEEIIESSQESFMDSSKTSPRRRSKNESKLKIIAKNKITNYFDETTKTVNESDLTQTRDSQKKSSPDTDEISQAETATCESNAASLTPEYLINLPKKPILTASEQIMASLDTVSFISDINDLNDTTITNFNETADEKTLQKEKDDSTPMDENLTAAEDELLKSPQSPVNGHELSLPTSPINDETLNRTSELLNSTLDISPIAEKAVVEPELNTDYIESTESEKIVEELPRPQLDIIKTKQRHDLTPRMKIKSRIGLTRSPSVARIKRIMCLTSANQECASKEEKFNDETEDILTFTREIPSPMAVPKTGILKRKLAETDEHYSPAAKRKRVNFSDPCTTSKKVFIKEVTSASDSLAELFRNSTNYGDLFDEEIENDFDVILRNETEGENVNVHATESPTMEIGAEVNIDCSNETVEDVKVPETPQNISEQLNGDFSFLCPELIVCSQEISHIFELIPPKQLKLFHLLLKHNLKNVKRISDLAELTETQFLKAAENNTELFQTMQRVLNQYYETITKPPETDVDSVIVEENIPKATVEFNEETVKNLSMDDMKKMLNTIKTVHGENVLGNELSDTFFVNKLNDFHFLNKLLTTSPQSVQLQVLQNFTKIIQDFFHSLQGSFK